MPRLTAAAAAALCLVSLAAPARAHDESLSVSDVVVSEREVRWTVDVGLAGLAKVVTLGTAATPGERVALSEAELVAHRPAIAAYLARGLEVSLDGKIASAEVGRLSPRLETLPGSSAPAITRLALELIYRSPEPIAVVSARVGFFSDLTAAHRAVLKIAWGDEWRQTTALGVTELRFEKGRLMPSRWRLMGDFLVWGVHHILIGLDHIAFVLALLLAAARMRELLLVVTSFTAAHSITILLSALEVVRVPAAVTEALIAASIVYVAAENLLARGRPVRGRWLLTFGFGLVHGLGFAEVLRERLAEVPGGIVLPVIAFNLGVELGQVGIILVVYPALVWLRRVGAQVTPAWLETRQKQIVMLGSLPIMAAGLYWLVTRL